jgi:hypothetical protein
MTFPRALATGVNALKCRPPGPPPGMASFSTGHRTPSCSSWATARCSPVRTAWTCRPGSCRR